ncbi:NmrA family NAD(P)-binding protein [Hyalangium gracile]|uniref:NmrA family NAD(P)-binding protein n=1 Tax=Hyalangium gracile TaxID=394092 RepID=UPI001CC9E37E|nr:NAD(P)H-binding protein [Hyalangium gracile]
METLVFGATGNIGSEVVRALAGRPEVHIRAATREVSQTRKLFEGLSNVEPVRVDWQQPGTLDAALAGVSHLVIINALSPEMAAQTAALIAAARRAQVSRVLRFSLMGAGEPEPILEARWHDAADEQVRRSGLEWVILKPNQYFQNFVGFGTDATVRTQGAIYLPYADARVSNIDTRDLGEIAARVLLAPPGAHAGKEYVLTGGVAQTMEEIAGSIGEVLGKPVRYTAIPEEPVRQAMTGAGMHSVTVEAILEWFAYCRAGRAMRVDPAATHLLGHPPRRSADFARDYAHRYQG